MDLYVIRHGQSENNAQSAFSGWLQVSLTEKGRSDAANTGRLLGNVRFDKIYASDLKRAMQTCEIATDHAEYETDPLLREINVGRLAGIPIVEAEEEYGDLLRTARNYRDYSPFEGESAEDQFSRVARFMRRLEQSDLTGNVAAFCHEGTARCMLDYVIGRRFAFPYATVDNGSVSIFSWNGEKWFLRQWNIT